MLCLCSKRVYRSKLCASCYRKKLEYYNISPTLCKKCPCILRMTNKSGLCKKHFHSKYIKEYILRSDRREKELEARRLYKKVNKIAILAKNTKRESVDIIFKIKRRLRHRLYMAVIKDQKVGSAIKDLGCSTSELKKHLESKFQPGMTWDNYGKWHIDHIIPLAKWNLELKEDVQRACHYSNLQPLWAIDNLKKGDN